MKKPQNLLQKSPNQKENHQISLNFPKKNVSKIPKKFNEIINASQLA
jgi:hypothetical protein